MEFSNMAICYEATQRIYRNAIVAHIRSIFLKHFPSDWKRQLVTIVGIELWDKNAANDRQRHISGEVRTKTADDFDLLDIAFFYNLFDKYFEVLFPSRPAETEKELSRRKRAVLDWTQTVKVFRDPLSHPPEQDFTFQDAFRMIDCASRVLEALELPESLQLQNIVADFSAGRTHGSIEPSDPLQHSLPPRESVVVDFIGRREELKILWDWLKDPHAHRWAIAGEGGKGKSAIAYEFAASVVSEAPPDLEAVWWMSAKKKKYMERRVVETSAADFCDLSSACNRLLIDYGRNDILETDLSYRQNQTLKLLNEIPALVVVDDLDSLEGEDEAAIEFLALSAPATRSKILLTTRRTIFGMAHTTTQVSGMNAEDFEKFLKSRSRMFGIDENLLTVQRIAEIAEITERSPLYAEDLLRLAASGSLHQAIRDWKDKEGDEARSYALGRELDMLSVEAKEALLCACLSAGPVSFSELEAITGLSKQRLRTAIAEMQRLFLVPKPRLIEGEERFDVNVNTRALVIKVLDGTDTYRRAKSATDAVKGRLPYSDRGKLAPLLGKLSFS